jgi:hypothetical protein
MPVIAAHIPLERRGFCGECGCAFDMHRASSVRCFCGAVLDVRGAPAGPCVVGRCECGFPVYAPARSCRVECTCGKPLRVLVAAGRVDPMVRQSP